MSASSRRWRRSFFRLSPEIARSRYPSRCAPGASSARSWRPKAVLRAALPRQHRIERLGERALLGNERQQELRRQRRIAAEMVEPGGDHGLRFVAIDQRRAERAQTDGSSRPASNGARRASAASERETGRRACRLRSAPARRRHRRRTPAPRPAQMRARRTRWARSRVRRAHAIPRRWVRARQARATRLEMKDEAARAWLVRALGAAPDENVEAEPALGDDEQQHGFEDQRGCRRDGGAIDADARDQHDTEHEIEHEGAGIDGRAERAARRAC